MGSLLVADYWGLVNQLMPSEIASKQERGSWRKIRGDGNFGSRIIAERFRLFGVSMEVEEGLTSNNLDHELMLARAMYLAHSDEGIEEAQRIFEACKGECDSWMLRMKVVELAYLLEKEESLIAELCSSWINNDAPKPVDQYARFHRAMIEEISKRKLANVETHSAWEQFRKDYCLALAYRSSGDMNNAEDHLHSCMGNRSMNVADHWVRAFLQNWDFGG